MTLEDTIESFNQILDLMLSKEEMADFRLFTPSLLFPAAKEVSKRTQLHATYRSDGSDTDCSGGSRSKMRV